MDALIYLLLWAGLFVLMMRFGIGAQVVGRGQTPNSPGGANENMLWIPPVRDTDPVCTKIISTAGAKSAVHAGHVFYFCSRECREIFEAAPELYLDDRAGPQPKLENSHA